MGDGEITKHGSALSTNNLPKNVEIVRHDGERKVFSSTLLEHHWWFYRFLKAISQRLASAFI